jgi:hypothetical protein
MFDRELAILFDAETMVPNKAVNRTIDWFPGRILFQAE